jgi:hypothetical protein
MCGVVLVMGGAVSAANEKPAKPGAQAQKAAEKNELPANVRAMVEKQLPGGTITGAEEETDDGRNLYYVAVETGGKKVTLLGSGRAQYLGIVDAEDDPNDDATYLEVETAPEAVRAAIKKQLGELKVESLGFEVEKERFFYVAEYEKEGKTHFATFTLQGDLTEEETDIALADVPAAVKAGVAKARPGGTIDSASEVVAKKKKSYAVEVRDSGKVWEVVVSEAGVVESSEVVEGEAGAAGGKKGK